MSASGGMCRGQSEPEESESLLESVEGKVARTCGGVLSLSRCVGTLYLRLFDSLRLRVMCDTEVGIIWK